MLIRRAATRSLTAVLGFVAALVVVALGVTGCSAELPFLGDPIVGQAVSDLSDPYNVDGLPTTYRPTGFRPEATHAPITIAFSDFGEVDQIGADALADIEMFWREMNPKTYDADFRPVPYTVSWDTRSRSNPEYCDDDPSEYVNAGYCFENDSLGWDRGKFMPEFLQAHGPIAVVTLLAHEYGHAVEVHAGQFNEDEILVAEQRADCLAGAFLRWVAEDRSPHYVLNTTDGLADAIQTLIMIRDFDINDPDAVHGSAYERATALQRGFVAGTRSCTDITSASIEERRSNLRQRLSESYPGIEPAITESVVADVSSLMQQHLPGPLPTTRYSHGTCSGPNSVRGAAVCADPVLLDVDLDELRLQALPADTNQTSFPPEVHGNFTVVAQLISRLVLGHHLLKGDPVRGPHAALRMGCETGAALSALAHSPNLPRSAHLSFHGLDEVISGVVTNGAIVSDLDGNAVPSAFLRLQVVEYGFLHDASACAHRYPI